MSRNMTRKSIAVGAGLALAASAMVGTPAYAAISFTTAPLSETGTGALLNSDFLIATTVADAPASAGTRIKYLVEGISAVSDLRTPTFELASTLAGVTALDYTTPPGSTPGATTNANGEIIIGNSGIQPIAATPYIILGVGLDVAEIKVKTTITLTPFSDGNNDNVFDSNLGEVKGSPISITYFPTDEVSVSGSQTISVSGNTVTVTVDIAEVNEASSLKGGLTQLIAIDSLVNGSSNTDTLSEDEYDEDRKTLRVANAATISSGDIVATKVFVGDETTEVSTLRTNLGTTKAVDFATSSADTVDEADNAANDIWIPAATNPFFLHDTTGSTTDAVRAGDGTLQAIVYVDGTDATGADPIAGETVTFTISEGNATAFDSDVSITSGGETLTDETSGTDKIEIDVVTDADGKAVLNLSYENLDNTNTFVIKAEVKAAGLVASGTRTLTAINSQGLTVAVTNTSGSSDGLVFEKAGSVSIDLAVRDSFGLVPAGTHRVQYWIDWGTSGASLDKVDFVVFDSNGNGTLTETAPDVAQTATLALLDIDTADGADVEGNEIDSQDSSGDYGVYSNALLVGPGATSTSPNDVVDIAIVADLAAVSSVSFVAASSHDATDTTNLVQIADATLYSLDTRTAGTVELDAATAYTPDAPSADQSKLTVLVTDPNGVALQGRQVTFSATGFEFTDEAGEIQSLDSLTVYSDSSGNAIVSFLTNSAGAHVVTATSGGQSDTLDVLIDAPDGEGDLASWSVSPSSSTVNPGSTLNFLATALDKWGNAIDLSGGDGVSVDYDGPGIVIPNDFAAIDSTNADGEVKLAIVFGSNDTGSYKITVSGDLATDTKTDDVAATYAFTIGDAPVVVPDYGTLKAWTVDQGDGTAKVYVKYPTLGDKVRIGHQTGGSGSYETIFVKTIASESDSALTVNAEGYYIVRTIDLDSGTNRIRVTVGDNTEVQVRYNE